MNHRRELHSGCFVIDQSDLALTESGSMGWAQVIGNQDQARKLSLFYIEARTGESPAVSLGEADAVLFLQQGQCTVSISGRKFDAEAGTGIHVRAHEQFSFINDRADAANWLISICPRVTGLNIAVRGQSVFNQDFPQRSVSGQGRSLQTTEDRFYMLLVGPGIGSESVTQFIGRIPPSRAPEHYHLYEEAICILSGHGRMWTGDRQTEIKPGSMIFLPRTLPHCLECLDQDGMELMGVFYPAGSPAINYQTA